MGNDPKVTYFVTYNVNWPTVKGGFVCFCWILFCLLLFSFLSALVAAVALCMLDGFCVPVCNCLCCVFCRARCSSRSGQSCCTNYNLKCNMLFSSAVAAAELQFTTSTRLRRDFCQMTLASFSFSVRHWRAICVRVHAISCRTRSGGASNSWRRSASERRKSERSRMRRGGGGRRRGPDGRRRRRSVCRPSVCKSHRGQMHCIKAYIIFMFISFQSFLGLLISLLY